MGGFGQSVMIFKLLVMIRQLARDVVVEGGQVVAQLEGNAF